MEIVGNEVYETENPKVMREARDFSHVRFTLQESVVGEQIFVYNHKDICLFRHKKYFERCKR